MTISIIVPGSSFTKYSQFVKLPYLSETTGYFLFGGDATSSITNLSPNAVGTPSILGTPTYSAGYVNFPNNGAGFKLGFINGKPFTYIIVARPKTDAMGLIGHWTSDGNPTATADALFANNTGLNLAVDGAARATAINVSALTGFAMYAGTYNGNIASLYAHNGTTLQQTNKDYVSATGQPVTQIRVGALNVTFGSFDAAAAVIFDKAMSAAQIAEIYTYLKGLLSTRGVTVI